MFNKMSLYRVKKGFVYLRYFGPKEFLIRLKDRIRIQKIDYEKWYENHRRTEEELESQRQEAFAYAPLISIVVPVYQAPEEFLRQMLLSVCRQTYKNWELCMAVSDEERHRIEEILEEDVFKGKTVRLIGMRENRGISENTNAAIKEAAGTYIGFLDQDDLLAPDALYEMVKKLNEYPEAGLLYSDEDKVTADLKKHFQPHFKPDFNLDLLRANNYICHFCVIKKSLIEEMGGLRSEFDGAQDYDLVFRCVEKTITAHVPRILYHWRVHQVSTADNPISKTYAFEAGQRAIEAHLLRCGEHAEVLPELDRGFYRVRYKVQGNPKISILIPNKDHVKDLEKCLQSISKSIYKNYEITIIENNSKKAETFAYYDKIESDHIRILRWDGPFNYSAINNYAVSETDGEYLVLLNNDTEVKEDFVEQMLLAIRRHKNAFSCAARMVQYHDRDKLDDAGNYYCALGWSFARGKGKNIDLYQKEEKIFSACGGAAIYRKKIMEKIGYFDEEHFAYLEDTDIGYRARIYGYENWYAPDAVVYHVGSGTSGSRYNHFKTRYSSRNNIYLIYKNMPLLQIILNLPFLAAGFLIKFLFFALKGMGKEYLAGIKNGFSISMNHRKVPFSVKHLPNYCKIQLELWENMFRRIRA